MSRRKKKTGPPRCNDCGAVITFFRSWTESYRPFNPRPVDGKAHIGPTAHPTFAGRAWLLEQLVDELMARTQQSRDDATDEAYALPWYVPHSCRTTTAPEEPLT